MLYRPHSAVLTLACMFVMLIPSVVLAEVSDKEPAAGLIWVVRAAAAFFCFLAARFKPWLGLVVFALPMLWFISLFLELHSADVGPHLLVEQGNIYYMQAYASFGLALGGLIAGLLLRRKASPE